MQSSSIISLLLFAAVAWFLLIRPQQIQAKKRAEMLTTLKAGDRIVTIGGICGEVRNITDTKVYVEIAEGVVVEFLRNAISQVEAPMIAEEDEDLFDEENEDEDFYYDEEEEETIVEAEIKEEDK